MWIFDLSVSNVAFSGEKSAVTLIFPAFQYSDRLYMGGLTSQIRQQQGTPRITADQSRSLQVTAGCCLQLKQRSREVERFNTKQPFFYAEPGFRHVPNRKEVQLNMKNKNIPAGQADPSDPAGKEVSVKSSEITKNSEWIKKVNKKREEFGRNSERYEAGMGFLLRYKSQDTPLSDDLKYLFTACKGQPIQDVLYNTGIYELPVENWTALSRQERYDLLFKCGAELYHYQRMLNKCIGRTYYNSAVKDTALLEHIQEEICVRFPFMEAEDFRRMQEDRIDYTESTFSLYKRIYLDSYDLEKGYQNSPTDLFVNGVQWHFQIHKQREDHFIKDEKSFWLSLTGKRTKGKGTLFTQTMRDSYGRRLYPTKDDLFVFAIAVGLSYEEFQELMQKAVRDCGDPMRYAYNKTSVRDALVLSVIRDIGGWYERTIEDLRCSGEYSSGKVVNQKSIYFSMEVLFRVDKMLWTNLYHRGQTPPVESLLYHNFLLDRKDLLYSGRYKEWCADHDFDQIIEFQESVKKDLREERKKELTGNR